MPLADLSKNRAPYRPPCSGEWTGQIMLGPSNYRESENGFQRYQNVTKRTVNNPGPVTGPIGPLPSCNESDPPCGQIPPDACAAGAIIFPAPPALFGNCFVPLAGETVNRAVCHKMGFKAVQAKKVWHGALGFNVEPCPDYTQTDPYEVTCSWYDVRPNPPAQRYLTATLMVEVYSASNPDTTPGPATGSYLMAPTINRFTGGVAANDFSSTWTDDNGTTIGTGADTDAEELDPDGIGLVAALDLVPSDGACLTSYTTTIEAFLRPDTQTVTTVTVSPTSWNYSAVTTVLPAGTILYTVTISLVLSNPYTAAQLDADCNDLLAQWNLSDDAQYPWRTDALITSVPLITLAEQFGTPFQAIFPGWVNNPTSTGRYIGAPTPAGYDPYFDFQHANYSQQMDGSWQVTSYGEFAPDWCPQATQWIDGYIAMGGVPGAWTMTDNSIGGIAKQKYAETILFAVPSHNFARPCGVDDATRVNPVSPCNAPTLQFPDCPNPCPDPPASGGQWNDIGLKGDFVTRVFSYNFRDGGEYERMLGQYNYWYGASGCSGDSYITIPAPPAVGPTAPRSATAAVNNLVNIAITQRCLSYAPCCPAAVYITPNGEASANSVTIPLPTVPIDQLYGSFAAADVQQWMVDPLFLPPRSCDPTEVYLPDDGSCGSSGPELAMAAGYDGEGINVQWYAVPYEEARSAPPAGAPALPAGYLMGASTPDGGITWVGPMTTFPSPLPLPWIYRATQIAYDCNVNAYEEFV